MSHADVMSAERALADAHQREQRARRQYQSAREAVNATAERLAMARSGKLYDPGAAEAAHKVALGQEADAERAYRKARAATNTAMDRLCTARMRALVPGMQLDPASGSTP